MFQMRSLASKLIRMATGGKDVSRHLTLEIKRRIRLEGAELDAYWQRKKEEQHEAARIRLQPAHFNYIFPRQL